MSMHELETLPGAPSGRQVRIGWDRALATFFAQVLDGDPEGEADEVVWVGTDPYEISNAERVLAAVRPYAAIPAGLQSELEAEAAREGEAFTGRPGTLLAAEATLPRIDDPDQGLKILRALAETG